MNTRRLSVRLDRPSQVEATESNAEPGNRYLPWANFVRGFVAMLLLLVGGAFTAWAQEGAESIPEQRDAVLLIDDETGVVCLAVPLGRSEAWFKELSILSRSLELLVERMESGGKTFLEEEEWAPLESMGLYDVTVDLVTFSLRLQPLDMVQRDALGTEPWSPFERATSLSAGALLQDPDGQGAMRQVEMRLCSRLPSF